MLRLTRPAATTHDVPACHLNDDALLEIFSDVYGIAASNNSTCAILQLSRVCRRWRRLIHGCSHFWSHLQLNIHHPEVDLRAAYWLDRAGNRPLAIELYRSSSHLGSSDVKGLARLSSVLGRSVDRWSQLKIEADLHSIRALFDAFSGVAQALERLEVRLVPDASGPSCTAVLPIPFIRHPSPRDNGVRIDFQDCIPVFTPSFQPAVTSIAIASNFIYQMETIFHVFQSCPNLIDLSLNSPSKETKPYTLPHSLPHRLPTPPALGPIVSSPKSLEFLYLSRVIWTTSTVELLTSAFTASPSLSRVSLLNSSQVSPESLNDFNPQGISGTPIVLENVTEFRISGAPIVYPLLRRLTLPQVQVLELEHVPFDIAYNLISSSTCLTSVSLRHIGEPAHPSQCLTIPTLTSLELFNAPNFLDCVHAPQLNHLSLCTDKYERPSLGSLPEFVEHSRPGVLHTLRLEGVEIADDDLIQCLGMLPQLKDLALVECSISDTILHALETPSTKQSSRWLLPHLTAIELKDNDDMTPDGAIKFLKSRNRTSFFPTLVSGNAPPRVKGLLSFSTDESFGEFKSIQASRFPT
ncbi:hypothetical protein BOTBODRAFT_43043 [Botryobasidium botryosum FD-172 SS1]|uniref:F-box domain-containing protein n=1 Tax=Botryobasidium botryosum (strain FD-172 SS1) TaxID=930990 RepID=A0A067MRU6_BOTB1|nr:hypothetical protein BOTBODRAFT_43043 [Botryobasidium botryosum FD-172 SS1]